MRRVTPTARQALGALGIKVAPKLMTREELDAEVERYKAADRERKRTTAIVLCVVFGLVALLVVAAVATARPA